MGLETRILLQKGLERGVRRTELARRLGVDRRTLRRWIETGRLDGALAAGASSSRRDPVERTLDPRAEFIQESLERRPRLSAQRLCEEVRATGCPGGCGRVRDCAREVRPRPEAGASTAGP